ncbi:MAG: metal-sensing transcriptional repressor [Helicobacter sp.]|uniref:metal-sensing transcriptional repressor n=1 Tax=Helicobacter sp. TaxID=218 RepID=UPI0025BA607B|nr:metal-sensing transcriptional repressor [Helicobacter sp.]MCH5313076.1 metal-sensing transcriptional repressor [Helicobacter sp.]
MYEQTAQNIHKRLQRIIGQLNGIDKMISENAPCPDVLIQLNAAKSAIHKVGQIVLEGHINHCVRDSVCDEGGDIDKTLNELAKAIEHFSRMS